MTFTKCESFTKEELDLVLTFLIATMDFLATLELFNEKYDELERIEFKVRRLMVIEEQEYSENYENFTDDELKLLFHCSLGISDVLSHVNGSNPNSRHDNLDLKLRKIMYLRTNNKDWAPINGWPV